MKNLSLKQFRSDGCLSYLLFDPKTLEAAIIDPAVPLLSAYEAYIQSKGLRPVIALDTHTHADHLSATHLLRERYGTEIGMSEKTKSNRSTKPLCEESPVSLGEVVLEVLETPGHTPDSLTFICQGLVFTGDTLFIGSSGRTDFPGADAHQQWTSIHKKIGVLPEDFIVLPGHDYSELLFSTLEKEKKSNSHWLPNDENKFVSFKKNEIMVTAADIQTRIDFNHSVFPPELQGTSECVTACGTALRSGGATLSISVAEYRQRISEERAGFFVDVREVEEFRGGHIPGTNNIPLSQLCTELKKFRLDSSIYVSCLSGMRSNMAAKTLTYLGYRVTDVLGGFKAWKENGFEIEDGT